MSEELERKYLAIIQESLMEKLELREENKKLKEELANISYKKDCELFTKKLNSSDFVVNEQNTKESESESDKYYIFDLDSCKYLVEDSNGYTFDKDKATIFVSLSNKNFVTQRVNLESNILDEDKKKVLLDYIDKKIAYYSESDLKNPISESMFHGRFAKELQKIRALLLCEVDTSSPWFDYHFS